MDVKLRGAQIAVRGRGSNKCLEHRGNELIFVCEECGGALACSECATSTHKQHTLETIANVLPNSKATIREFVDNAEKSSIPHSESEIKSIDGHLSENQKHFEDMIVSVKDQNRLIKSELDKATDEFADLFTSISKENKGTILKYQEELQAYSRVMNVKVQRCKEALESGNGIQIYEVYCDVLALSNCPNWPTINKTKYSPRAISTIDMKQILCETIDDFTKVNSNTDNAKWRVTSQFIHKSFLGSLHAVSKDFAWSHSLLTTKLQLLDQEGKVQQTEEMGFDIIDFCISPINGHVWTCNSDYSVREIILQNSATERFQTASEPKSICAISSDCCILVGLENQITKYTQRGQVVCSTPTAKVTLFRNLFNNIDIIPHRISECPITNNIAVVDWKRDGVLVFDYKLEPLYSYDGENKQPSSPDKRKSVQDKISPAKKSENTFQPYDVCYKRDGNILVADYDRNEIILLSGRAELIEIVYTDPNLNPKLVSVHHNGDIWVVSEEKYVKIIKQHSV